MDTNLLVDAIMRQTTVLIGQLAAAAGIRAPLAHLADEVFISLSQELENQGVPRKVVADMFGVALRTYQRKVQRLRESATQEGRTLWQAVLDHMQEEGQATRLEILQHFQRDDPAAIAAVLNELVQGGLLSRTGTGADSVFVVTPEEARLLLLRKGREETARALVWLDVCHHESSTIEAIAQRLAVDRELIAGAARELESSGQLRQREDGSLLAEEGVIIPVDAQEGWEAAVFDHFQAMVAAIGSRLRQSQPHTGGTTLSFDLHDEHPLREETLALLSRVRQQTDELFSRVVAENTRQPVDESRRQRLVFYFGQHVVEAEDEA